MIKAKIIIPSLGFKLYDIVYILKFIHTENGTLAICKDKSNSISTIMAIQLEIIDEPEQLSKDTQAQVILFEGQCRLQAMLINNKQREIANYDVFNYSWDDFMGLQEEIQCRINELNKEK